jgi:hypothetical protein
MARYLCFVTKQDVVSEIPVQKYSKYYSLKRRNISGLVYILSPNMSVFAHFVAMD